MNEHVESLNQVKATVVDLAIRFGPKVFVAIAIMVAGIALAMQGVLGNAVAGLTIIFTRPFRIGEYIAIAGVEGKVENITLFSTTLVHADLSQVVVPNRKIVGEILPKYGKFRQLGITVGVAYDTDLNMMLATIGEILQGNPRVLKDPAPGFGISVLANSSIHISVNPWVNVPDYGPAGSEINKALVETFRGKSISIPFPQHEVRMLGNVA